MQQEDMENATSHLPGLMIAALRGGSGKTILSIGIAAAWRNQKISVTPFKKGPDYIDAGWLALASGRPCYNIDTFLCSKEQVLYSFQSHTTEKDIAVIEGNRGLYDGIDIEGNTSTAEIAKLLGVPVVLCIDCTKMTRTAAAIVSGCIAFDNDVNIKGVLLNRVAGARHENILRTNIEHYCGIPVVGAVPKLNHLDFPERHMGLVPTPEHAWAINAIKIAAEVADQYIDLDALSAIARESTAMRQITTEKSKSKTQNSKQTVKIGILKDSAFQFYYPDNIEGLESAGAEIVFTSPLTDKTIPDVDALYIGGGFPETHAKELADNVTFREQLRSFAQGGLPIYAECGGLMYLGEALVLEEKTFPMAGVLPIVFGISKKPQGHGYSVSLVDTENPYFSVGTELRGHEFRYSKILKWRGNDRDMVFATQRGAGFVNSRDGICYKNVLASYTHLHSLGTPAWAEAMVRNAQSYKSLKER